MSEQFSLFNQGPSLPELPYNGSSGWSGSETSEARVVLADKDGTTRLRQSRTLFELECAGPRGLTWRELADLLGIHHGAASGALSVLHKTGQIFRLKKTRSGSKVYVTPEHLHGRETEPHGRKKHVCPNCGTEVA